METSKSRGHQVIESLLSKPSGGKPDFAGGVQSLLSQSSALSKAKAFMPGFALSTDKIISDPAHAKMDITIAEADEAPTEQEPATS